MKKWTSKLSGTLESTWAWPEPLGAFSRLLLSDRINASRAELIGHIKRARTEDNRLYATPFTVVIDQPCLA